MNYLYTISDDCTNYELRNWTHEIKVHILAPVEMETAHDINDV